MSSLAKNNLINLLFIIGIFIFAFDRIDKILYFKFKPKVELKSDLLMFTLINF